MSNKYPKLEVSLGKSLDKRVCSGFINKSSHGLDFGEGITILHPQLIVGQKETKEKRKQLIDKYFDDYYKTHEKELLRTVDNFQVEWNGVADSFYSVCEKYFGNFPWPEGKYNAHLSIINCNPIFYEHRVFQVFWKYPLGFVAIAAHEMVHFLFYALVLDLFPEIDIKDKKIKQVAEVFNGIIFKEKEFIEVIKKPTPQYPGLIKLQGELEQVWNKDKNAKSFVLSVIS